MVGPIRRFAARYTHRAPMSCLPLDLEQRKWTASRRIRLGRSDGRNPVPAPGEGPVLAPRCSESADQLRPQVLWLDDVVDHQFAGQPEHVDVGLVLRPQPLGLRRPLGADSSAASRL